MYVGKILVNISGFNDNVLYKSCWLGGRKGIQPVKKLSCGVLHGYLSGARCRLAYGPADATATHCLASVKSRLVLPFWYWLTWVKVKVFPYSLPSVGPGADPSVQAVSPQVT